MKESKSFYLVIESQASFWNPMRHLPVQAGIIVQCTLCLLFNIAARNDLYANFGLKPIVFQTFFMFLDFEAFWSTAHVSAGHKVFKASI